MRFLGFALMFASFSAMACPQLTGTYAVCRSSTGATDGSSNVVITQTGSGSSTVYTITSTDDESQERTTDMITANGVPVMTTETSPQGTFTTTTTATCSGSTLNLTSTLDWSGQAIGALSVAITRRGAQMLQNFSGEVMGTQVADSVVCQ